MKRDISTFDDVKTLVDSFYNIVREDEVIGYVFTDVAKIDWDAHLPKMYSFWESILLDKATYKGNPMIKHIDLSKKEKLTKAHFERWIQIWEKNVDDNFEGAVAGNAKFRARTLKELMLQKFK